MPPHGADRAELGESRGEGGAGPPASPTYTVTDDPSVAAADALAARRKEKKPVPQASDPARQLN